MSYPQFRVTIVRMLAAMLDAGARACELHICLFAGIFTLAAGCQLFGIRLFQVKHA